MILCQRGMLVTYLGFLFKKKKKVKVVLYCSDRVVHALISTSLDWVVEDVLRALIVGPNAAVEKLSK